MGMEVRLRGPINYGMWCLLGNASRKKDGTGGESLNDIC